jgi:hypothetical protein
MRRAVLLGAAAVVVAAAGATAILLPAPTAPAGDGPHITRLFIPAIKTDCRERSGIPDEGAERIGYTFTSTGALTTVDRDGRLTGIDAARLARFNECLAQYPIEPIQLTPHDHYSRNLLYDYFTNVLRPCLTARVSDELPPIPSRADFVVRLFNWDPYRVLAPGRQLHVLLDLATECPALPPYLSAA